MGWSKKYKRSIDCNNPKGFSQKAHCAGRNKRENKMNIKELVKSAVKEVVAEDKLNMFLSPRLYYTNDKKNTSHRNQLPHFDHIRKIKVFLYLEDIDEDTGPTEFAPRSNNSLFLKYIRIIRFFSRIGTKGMKNIFLWNSYSSKLNFSKAIGKKGDIYIFDTDTVHKAGLVKELSKERKLLRFDFEINTHNQNLLLFCYKKISGLKKIISKT